MSEWLEVGADNHVLVTEGSLLNTGLIIGSERAMVIDTGCGPRQGREILDAVREKTLGHPQRPLHQADWVSGSLWGGQGLLG